MQNPGSLTPGVLLGLLSEEIKYIAIVIVSKVISISCADFLAQPMSCATDSSLRRI